MEKKLVVINQGNGGHNEVFADIFRDNGWKLETFDLSKEGPLPKNLEKNGGLLILSKTANIFEQSFWPRTVFMGS